jgi:CheY-like chemotaxis protein
MFSINNGPARVSHTINMKQNGVCRYCNRKFSDEEQIVSNGKRKKYYHRQCAEKLNIVVFLSRGSRNSNPKVLIVDDEYDIVQLYQSFLQEHGFDVEAFTDPQSALLNYKPNYYDLLLLDIRMPGMSGFEFYKIISEKEETIKPKVCFVSAYSELAEEVKKNDSELDGANVLKKPVAMDHLYERVNELLL